MGADYMLVVDQPGRQFIGRWFVVFWHWKGKDGALQAPAEESK